MFFVVFQNKTLIMNFKAGNTYCLNCIFCIFMHYIKDRSGQSSVAVAASIWSLGLEGSKKLISS